MKTTLSVLIVASLALSGCATMRESRVNPMNWFGGSAPTPMADPAATGANNPLIPAERASVFRRNEGEPVYGGRPVQVIDELLVERRPGGAIIRVTGIAERVGPFEVRIVEDIAQTGNGTLAYTLKALQSPGPRGTGEHARKVTAAIWLTDQELSGVSAIRVAGASNALVTRR